MIIVIPLSLYFLYMINILIKQLKHYYSDKNKEENIWFVISSYHCMFIFALFIFLLNYLQFTDTTFESLLSSDLAIPLGTQLFPLVITFRIAYDYWGIEIR